MEVRVYGERDCKSDQFDWIAFSCSEGTCGSASWVVQSISIEPWQGDAENLDMCLSNATLGVNGRDTPGVDGNDTATSVTMPRAGSIPVAAVGSLAGLTMLISML